MTITENHSACGGARRTPPLRHPVPGLAVAAAASAGLGMTAQAAIGIAGPQGPAIAFAIDSMARMTTYSAYSIAVLATASFFTVAAAEKAGVGRARLRTAATAARK
ncbi:hypothetical protein ACIREO_23495 [Streptomyces sp. NPDC102441]|uniref:hypothetical protein n=1 Tax=Streptomyces sp. NPDC102441 TaxID=3366176 RepID=UPI0037FCE32C